jgi:hypothetical protein
MTAKAAARARRIKYETSKRFCREIINAAVENTPNLLRRLEAASAIQLTWRTHCRHQALKNARREALERQKVLNAARRIQTRVRVYLIRVHAELAETQRRDLASITISSRVRQWLCANRLRRCLLAKLQNASATVIQSFVRVALAKKSVRLIREHKVAVRKSEAVLARFFLRVSVILGIRRKQQLYNTCSIMIQKNVLSYIGQRNYLRLKTFATNSQKMVRGFLARKQAAKRAKDVAADNLLIEPEPIELPETIDIDGHHDELNEEEDQLCENSLSGQTSQTKSVDQVNIDNPSLGIDDSIRILQQWFRRILCSRHKAARVITKAIQIHVARKRARLEWEKSRRKYRAATRIQTCFRVIQAKQKVVIAIIGLRLRIITSSYTCLELSNSLQMKIAMDKKLNLSLQEIEKEFNAKWKLPIIKQILNRVEDTEPKKVPEIRKHWLLMMPKTAYPPFKYTVVD